MKRYTLFILCALATMLSGCAHKEGKVLALYSYDGTTTYVFDEYDNFYVLEDDIAIPITQHFECTPSIRPYDVDSEFSLDYVSVGKYFATQKCVWAYCTKLQGDGYIMSVSDISPYLCSISLESQALKVKMYVDSDCFVRIFAIDEAGEGILPPYTDESDLCIRNH